MATILHTLPNGDTVQRLGWFFTLADAWGAHQKIPFADIIAQLGKYGLDTTAARQLADSDAFTRAVKAIAGAKAASVRAATNDSEDLILREIDNNDPDKLCYQLTREFTLQSGNNLGYTAEATICFSRSTSVVDGSDKALTAEVIAELPRQVADRPFKDVNAIVRRIFERELGVSAIAPYASGVIYVPDMAFNGKAAGRLLDDIRLFLFALGARPKTSEHINPRVPAVVVPPTTPNAPPAVPTPVPSSVIPSGDDVADAYSGSLIARLAKIEESVLGYLTTTYKHAKRAQTREQQLRDDISAAMTEIETLGREGYLGTMWEKFYDYRAGLDYLLSNGNYPAAQSTPIAVAPSTPIPVAPSAPVSTQSVPAAVSTPIVIQPPSVELTQDELPKLPEDLQTGKGDYRQGRIHFTGYSVSAA